MTRPVAGEQKQTDALHPWLHLPVNANTPASLAQRALVGRRVGGCFDCWLACFLPLRGRVLVFFPPLNGWRHE